MSERRKLSARGRVIAAGVSLGAAGVLAAAMAVTDTAADATPATPVTDAVSTPGSFDNTPAASTDERAVPFTPSSGSDSSTPSPAPLPQTRTGGS